MGAGDIKPVRGGSGAIVISTPKGIMFGEEARKQHVGGEALFEIW
jgi:small subunit ribosomal protein S8